MHLDEEGMLNIHELEQSSHTSHFTGEPPVYWRFGEFLPFCSRFTVDITYLLINPLTRQASNVGP